MAYNGPFPCKANPNISIFRRTLRGNLTRGERVIADRGYCGDNKIFTPDHFTSKQYK